MSATILRRIGQTVVVLWGVSTLVFALTRLSGDPVALMLPPDATVADRAAFRAALGLDRPLLVQYGEFLARAAVGDFGESMRFNRPAMQLVLDRVPASAELSIAALALALLVAVPLGTLAARRRGTWIDAAASFVALAGQSVPVFWLGIMAILVFSDTLNWLPSGGVGTPAHLVLPAVTLALLPMAMVMRMLRSTLLDVQPADYVRTARAKGLGERAILMRHMYKNAAGPVVTVIGLTVGSLVGGAVIVESVFAWPGLGRLAVQAIANRDFPVVQAFVFLVALAITAVNLLVDMAYTWLDPRVRL